MTILDLFKECAKQIKKGNGNKKIIISDDDEGNGFHRLFFSFTDDAKEFKDVCYNFTDTELDESIILG